MSEDGGQLATDLAGDRQAPGGIYALGEPDSEHVSLDHGVTVICDSRRSLIARMAVRAEAKASKRPRIFCPAGCGRMATVYISRGDM